MSTFLVFGNLRLPFDRMVEICCGCFSLMPRPIYIQAGFSFDNFIDRKDQFDFRDVFLFRICPPTEFETHIKYASVVVSHAGVGAISMCLEHRKYSAVFARSSRYGEHVDDHQIHFANHYSMDEIFKQCNDLADLKEFLENKIYLKRPSRQQIYSDDALVRDLKRYIKNQREV